MGVDLVLVYPPKICTAHRGDVSLALLYLAGAARDCGVCDSICIFDFNVPYGRGKTIDDFSALMASLTASGSGEKRVVVAINCLYSALFPAVRDIALKAKKYPGVKVVTGGMHPTLFAKEIIDNCPELDAVAIGEFDLDFPTLLKYFCEDEPACLPDNLEGVYLRINNEKVYKPKTRYIHDLDALPRPGYEYFNFQDYEVDTTNWWSPDGVKISSVQLPILTSRSCPNKCSFCSMRLVMGDKFRPRSAENVFEEIRYLYDTFGINFFMVDDDNLTLNRNRIINLCKMIVSSGIKAYFFTEGGISLKTLDEEVVTLMRQAGFISVALAVESGSDYIRNEIMGKHISREQIINAFKICGNAGMNVKAFFIVGMPEETEDSLKETADLIGEIEAINFALSVAKPLPGTQLFKQCVRDNLLIGGFDEKMLWTGEAEKNNERQEEPYIEFLLNHRPRHFWIRPYNLSVDRLVEIDMELQKIAYEKSKNWVEHVRRSIESTYESFDKNI